MTDSDRSDAGGGPGPGSAGAGSVEGDERDAAVSLSGVTKTYRMGGEVTALDEVSFEIPRGSYTAVMGPSGSGKSTLMNLVGCLDTPTAGDVVVDGRPVAGLSDAERAALRGEEIGFVFQTFNLMPRLTAAENVALPLVFRDWPRDRRRERATELLEAVGLGDRLDHRPNELSGGQRQRVAIARALANDPAILLADEPTGNLDTETGERIMALFEELHAAGHTILLVTHERHVAEHAERIVRLVDGDIERVEELRAVGRRRVDDASGQTAAATEDPGRASGAVGDPLDPPAERGRFPEFAENVRMSWRAIRDHALRSVLTTLGIVIGVAAVITFVTLGTSLQAAIIGDIAGAASPEMSVSVGPPGAGPGGGPGGGSIPVFTADDVETIRDIEGVARVVPRGTVQVSSLGRGNRTVAWQSVTATTAAAFNGSNFSAGGPFEDGRRQVVLNEPAAAIFAENASVGETLTIRTGNRTVEVEVVGVLNETGGFGADVPQVLVPVDPFYETTVRNPDGDGEVRAYPSLTVRASDFESVTPVQTRVEAYLNGSSDARALKPDSYEFAVRSNQQLVDQIESAIGTFTGFITGVAVISLLVGAIGIANIMLVSVTERTREIGIMKAVGATKRDVLSLFLVEAVVLGVVGSIVGTGVGMAGGVVAADFVGFPAVFAYEWIPVAVGVGVLVGVVAGAYPAWNAARVDPIDALRYE